MKTEPTMMAACFLLFVISIDLSSSRARAERLSKSDLDSTLQPRCSHCWNPSSSEQNPGRLPTFERQRPRRPPDSRPHRLPKGRYKVVPNKKRSPLSTLRTRLRKEARLADIRQIVVLDGDTIRVGSDRIRLRGIDTPEVSKPEGQARKQRLEELLRAGPVRIVLRGRDVFDRLVADVFVNNQNVAEILKREGFVRSE